MKFKGNKTKCIGGTLDGKTVDNPLSIGFFFNQLGLDVVELYLRDGNKFRICLDDTIINQYLDHRMCNCPFGEVGDEEWIGV